MSEKGGKTEGIRNKIQESIDHAHEEHKRELFRRRLNLARQGVRDYSLKRMADAVKSFETYIRILEDWKGVPEGGLHPALFDKKVDAAELVLIAGVYWDLAKLYDRTKSKEKEFRHYLEKYIIFTKGMPCQALGAETLRKYVRNEKPIHKDQFRNAYKMITGSNCFIATSLIDVCDYSTLEGLRYFRENSLRRSLWGRAFISWYENNGQKMASIVDRLPNGLRRLLGLGLDIIASTQNRADSSRSKN